MEENIIQAVEMAMPSREQNQESWPQRRVMRAMKKVMTRERGAIMMLMEIR